jgi:hypothetical protein
MIWVELVNVHVHTCKSFETHPNCQSHHIFTDGRLSGRENTDQYHKHYQYPEGCPLMIIGAQKVYVPNAWHHTHTGCYISWKSADLSSYSLTMT